MKAAIYNPYWDTLGGGERYTASFIKLLLDKKYKVDIQWKEPDLPKKIKSRFDIDISKSKVVEDVKRGDGYDLLFWLSDGSIPTLKSRNNILHFQFPFRDTGGNSLFNRMKMFRIKSVVCNSEFTKSFIDKEYAVDSTVIYPPVDVESFKSGKKENKILYVGRFSQLTQSKNQHLLVDAFKQFYDKGNKDWKLVLAGGAEVGAKKYVDDLRKSTEGYPVSIKTGPTFSELKRYYASSKIFWSAVGYNVEAKSEPLKVEHFGMTLVEAMSAKSIPIVPDKGGYKEIIDDNINGLFWNGEIDDLINKTVKVIDKRSRMQDMSKKAQESSLKFSINKFNEEFTKLI